MGRGEPILRAIEKDFENRWAIVHFLDVGDGQDLPVDRNTSVCVCVSV